MFSKFIKIFSITTVFLWSLGSVSSQIANSSKVIASVDGVPITQYDLSQRIILLSLFGGIPQDRLNGLSSQILDQIIIEKLYENYANNSNIEVSGDKVKTAIEDVARKAGLDYETFVTKFQDNGVSVISLYDYFRAQILSYVIVSREVEEKAGVTEQEIKNEIKNIIINKNEKEYNLYQIVVPFYDDENKVSSFKKINKVYNELKKGADFKKLVIEYSETIGKEDPGALGWLKLDQLSPQLSDVVSKLKPKQYGKVIEMSDYYTILWLDDIRVGGVLFQPMVNFDNKFKLARLSLDVENSWDIYELEKAEKNAIKITGNLKSCASFDRLIASGKGNKESYRSKFVSFPDLSEEEKAVVSSLQADRPSVPIVLDGKVYVYMTCGSILDVKEDSPEIIERVKADLQQSKAGRLINNFNRNLRRQALIVKN